MSIRIHCMCIYTSIHTCTNVCMHAYTYMYWCTLYEFAHVDLCICKYVREYVWTNLCKYVHMHVWTNLCKYVHMHVHIYMRMYICSCTYALSLFLPLFPYLPLSFSLFLVSFPLSLLLSTLSSLLCLRPLSPPSLSLYHVYTTCSCI